MRPLFRKELLKKIQELEARNGNLRDQLSMFNPFGGSHEHTSQWTHDSGRPESPSWKAETSTGRKWTQKQYFDVMDSMGQATHILGPKGRIIYWNHSAKELYGFTKEEAIGKGICELIVDDQDALAAETIITRVQSGERWTGQFPVVTKSGDMVPVMCTLTPFYDDDDTLIGAICIGADARPFREIKLPIMGTEGFQTADDSRPFTEIELPMLDTEGFQTGEISGKPTNSCTTRLGREPEQSPQTSVASKLTNLASKFGNKVRSKLKAGDSNVICEGGSGSGASTPRGEPPPCGVFSPSTAGKSPVESRKDASFESEGKTAFDKLTSRAQSWIGEKAMQWTRRGNEHESSENKGDRFGWTSAQVQEVSDHPHLALEQEIHIGESSRPVLNEGSGSWSSFIINSRSPSSSGSGSSSGSNSVGNRLEAETDSADYEIKWEDLTIGEQIGSGSCGTVYHGLWYGTDIAIKVFSKEEYSEETVLSFKQERLRQPNVLLFMGAVTSPQRLSIVTELLPRGSLFKLLRKITAKLDWKRRIHMAIDIARGMNYLHSCSPPIVHRDLKSSNLLVDKNWMVKVADFGLSRVKHETYLTTRTGKGTPQWMAPEVIRTERSDENFGVILWELTTQRIPWEELNAMQSDYVSLYGGQSLTETASQLLDVRQTFIVMHEV